MPADQLSFFSAHEHRQFQRYQVSETYALSSNALKTWIQRIYQFQQGVRNATLPKQPQLFDDGSNFCSSSMIDPTTIDPFILKQHNIEFWRWQWEDAGAAAFYFVIDHEQSILLYIGETGKSNQRWKGDHDCKRYVTNYVAAHRQQDLPTAVNIAFLNGAPEAQKLRRKLELQFIERWKTPFNKQNWKIWDTPFVN